MRADGEITKLAIGRLAQVDALKMLHLLIDDAQVFSNQSCQPLLVQRYHIPPCPRHGWQRRRMQDAPHHEMCLPPNVPLSAHARRRAVRRAQCAQHVGQEVVR